MPTKNDDRVTIGLYSLETDKGFNPAVLNEVGNISKIKHALTRVAIKNGREPPEIVVSILLIPNWKNGSGYNTQSYKDSSGQFMFAMISALEASHLPDTRVENFYEVCGDIEKAYLEGLIAKGSNADMIKMHALIKPENETRRHLQMDSNTQIHDYDGLYNITFGAADQGDRLVGLNASYYDNYYVSAHNKIVYTSPGSPLIHKLREEKEST